MDNKWTAMSMKVTQRLWYDNLRRFFWAVIPVVLIELWLLWLLAHGH